MTIAEIIGFLAIQATVVWTSYRAGTVNGRSLVLRAVRDQLGASSDGG